MKRYVLGRVIGALVGLPAGVFGVGFGLLVGTLVDQAVMRSREHGSVARLLESPLQEPAVSTLQVETAVLVMAFVVAGEGAHANRALLVRRLIEICAPPPRRTAELARLCQQGDELALHAHSSDLGEFLRLRLAPDQCEAVIDLLLSLAREPLRVKRLADRLEISSERYRALRDPYRVLDPQACAVLGLPHDCSPDEVKHVYRSLAAQFHPDAAAGLDESQRVQAEQAYIKVQAAYQTIMREFDA